MKESALRISVVSYLNSKPFLKGLQELADKSTYLIHQDIPSECAAKLLRDEADIGLIPVAMIPQLKEAHIISDYCIAANGAVESVVLVSNTPLDQIRTILMDQESRTSVMLAKILSREYWKITAAFTPQPPGHDFSKPALTEAAVLIGDKALEYRNLYPYQYDLAAAWKEHTGLPFVFAAWTSNKPVEPRRIAELNEIFKYGIAGIKQISETLQSSYPYANVEDYLSKKIAYSLSTEERKGLRLFLEKLREWEQQPSGTMVTAIDIK
jgi:chorismate dehydratase